MQSRRAFIASLSAFGLLPVAGPVLAAEQDGKWPLVASFSILADFCRNVGGDRVGVTSLVGANADTHVYQPSPADGKTLAAAKLVVVNGLGLEGWIDRLIKASGTKAPVVVATKGIKPLQMIEDGHRTIDPHAWQSVDNAKIYVGNIATALIAADPGAAAVYAANAKAYSDQLDALEADVKAAIAAIPKERRRIITTHDAFGYFGAAYDFQFIAPQGVSTEAEPSARDVAKIIRQIKAENIPAVFLESVTDTRMMERIARESGAAVGGALYSDALSPPGAPAATYLEMVRHNVKQLKNALAGA